MADLNINKTWKVRGKKTSNKFPPIIGCVYEGVCKFFGKRVVGILLETYQENDEAVLKNKQGERISADLLTLKALVDE